MKAIKLKRKSWHYWVATKVADYSEGDDFCAYLRNVIGGLFLMFLLCVAGFVVLCMLAHLVMSGYTCWFTTKCTFDKTDKTTLGIAGVLSALALYCYLCIKHRDWKASRAWEKRHLGKDYEPSFWEFAWDSIRNKTCFRVEFEAEVKPTRVHHASRQDGVIPVATWEDDE